MGDLEEHFRWRAQQALEAGACWKIGKEYILEAFGGYSAQ